MLLCFCFSTVRGARARPRGSNRRWYAEGVSCPRRETRRRPLRLFPLPLDKAGELPDFVPPWPGDLLLGGPGGLGSRPGYTEVPELRPHGPDGWCHRGQASWQVGRVYHPTDFESYCQLSPGPGVAG